MSDLYGELERAADAGNWGRVLECAERILADDPLSAAAHGAGVMAHVNLGSAKEARRHAEALLALEPGVAETHRLAALYQMNINRLRRADHHLRTALEIDPDDVGCLVLAAGVASGRLKFKRARQLIDRALVLAPDDATVKHTAALIGRIGDDSAERAAATIRELESVLALEPENAGAHHSLGVILLDDGDEPAAAEAAFRQAVRLEPGNREYQRDLFRAVARRSLLYRTFAAPGNAFRGVLTFLRLCLFRPWWILLPVVLAKFTAAFLIWLVFAGVVCGPLALLYQWLLVAELESGASTPNWLIRVWGRVQRWPGWARGGVALAGAGLYWAVLGWWMQLGPAGTAALFGGYLALALLLTGLVSWLRRARIRRARRKLETKPVPPPVPPQY